jgi:hypothetical protein
MGIQPLVWWCMCKAPLYQDEAMRVGSSLYAKCARCTCVILTMKLSTTLKGSK